MLLLHATAQTRVALHVGCQQQGGHLTEMRGSATLHHIAPLLGSHCMPPAGADTLGLKNYGTHARMPTLPRCKALWEEEYEGAPITYVNIHAGTDQEGRGLLWVVLC